MKINIYCQNQNSNSTKQATEGGGDMFSVNGREDLASLLGFTEREYSPSKIKKKRTRCKKKKKREQKQYQKNR